ncbi:hypothetical protein FRC98_06260 [Lujinxingia vulgaris]|uniref:TNFR-Cys domain-containing protein n=1 Tax=Lujinxingia vulgaris TaxID=2600176 RepID=A0A5C6X9B0_9DELT|nr:hypothetical protein [Lujinxingia vulgaris]TXD38482.1 hypothetical protein FRC98_06260 [Lujinxingia vulgaris]
MRTQRTCPTRPIVSAAMRALLLAALAALLASCAFESPQLAQVSCENEGEIEVARRCEGGFWVDIESPEDGGLSDADAADTCVPLSDEALCEQAQVACGPLTVDDGCGESRTIDCGGCAGEPYEEEVGQPYPCCESGQSCMCQDVERFEPRCEAGTCEVVSLGVETRASGCEACEAQCDDPSECGYASSCALTGERTQTCVGQACVDGACVESAEPFERTEICERDTDGESCVAVDACSVGSCEAGECASTPICDGTTASCGCESCQDCSELDGWYTTSAPTPCCDEGGAAASCLCQPRERRVYRCDGTSCAYDVVETDVQRTGCETCAADGCGDYSSCQTASTCALEGTQTRTCEVAVCSPETGLCAVEIEQESETCNVTTDGTTCSNEVFPGCDFASCSSGSCVTMTQCENTDTSCGCESCEDCTQRPDEWHPVESSFVACCEGNDLCECGVEERHEWTCGASECELTATGDTRAATPRGCNTCGSTCLESVPGPCCSAGASGNCQ